MILSVRQYLATRQSAAPAGVATQRAKHLGPESWNNKDKNSKTSQFGILFLAVRYFVQLNLTHTRNP